MKFEEEFTNIDCLDDFLWDHCLTACLLLGCQATECFVANRHNTTEINDIYEEVEKRVSKTDGNCGLSEYKGCPVVVEIDEHIGFFIRRQDFAKMFLEE